MHLFRAGAGKTGMGLEIIGCRWLVLLTLLLGCGETSGGSSPAKARPHVVLRQNEGSWIVSGLGTFAAKEGLKTVGFSWRAETKEWHLPLLEGEGGRGGGGGGRGRGGLGGRGGVGSRAAFKMIRDNVKRVCAEHGVRLAPIERGASGLAGSPAKLGSLSSSKKRARMRPEMVRDDEWMAIVDQDLNPGESMKVVATAGSGKTTVLKEYAQKRPHLRFLYVTYNKDMKEEKMAEFRDEDITNVEVRTMHSVAYVETSHLRSKPPCSSLHSCVLKDDVGGDYALRSHVIDTISNFLSSDHRRISREHVDVNSLSESLANRCDKGGGGRDRDLAALSQPTAGDQDELMRRCDRVVHIAQRLWHEMSEPGEERLLTHDGYLKCFQLDADRQVQAFAKYDVIMLDEAHDCSPAQLDIVMKQRQPKLIVFDPHQCIYGYRGALAVNLLDSMSTTHIKHIRSTFRYGAPLSNLAAQVIKYYKHLDFSNFHIKPLPEKKTLVNSTSESKLIFEEVCGRGKRQLVVLARTNRRLFEEVAAAIEHSDVKRISFLGGIEDACGGLEKILDLFKLSQMSGPSKPKGRIQDKYLKAFVGKGGFDAYTNIVDLNKDQRAQMTISIVNQFQDKIPDLIKTIQSRCVSDPSKADVIFTTTHKAKGLGWPDVYLSSDFLGKGRSSKDFLMARRCAARGLSQQQMNWDEVKRPSGGPLSSEEWSELRGNIDMEEVNLLYVAMTRAKQNLWVHAQTWDYILGPLTSVSAPLSSSVVSTTHPMVEAAPPLKKSAHS